MPAEAPFSKAWSQLDRTWAFPLSDMQLAAKSRRWLPEDFAAILTKTEQLSGQSHHVWKDALSTVEDKVKAWAFGLTPTPSTSDPHELVHDSPQSDPPWQADELLLVLNLYLRCRGDVPTVDSPEVAELLDALVRVARVVGTGTTINGPQDVHAILLSFERCDGVRGWMADVDGESATSSPTTVWRKFAHDPARVSML